MTDNRFLLLLCRGRRLIMMLPTLAMLATPVTSPTYFRCPLCSHLLLPHDSGLRCRNGHTFDQAREGHVHLLPPKKRAAQQSEVDAQIRARRAFYEAGGFATQAGGLADEVVRAAASCPAADDLQVLAAGCGEGLFLRTVEERWANDNRSAVGLWGTDMEKQAVRYAARRQPSARFAVASPHRLPFADGVLDVVFAAFTPAPWDEFCRVLRPGGAVVVARPGPDHLYELQQRVSGGVAAQRRVPKQFPAALAENYVRVRTEEALTGSAAASLLEMTPLVRRASERARADLQQQVAREQPLECTIDLIVSTHRVWLGTGGEPI